MDLDDEPPAPTVAPPRRVRLSVAIALIGLASAAAVAAMWFGGPGLRAVMQESAPVEAAYGVATPSTSATTQRGVETSAASVVSPRGEASGGSSGASAPVAIDVPVVVESPAQVDVPAQVEVPAHVPVRKPVVRPRVDAVVSAAVVQVDAPSDPLLEVRGLARARAALRDGDAKSALRLLDAHRREHPQSAYDEERDLLVVAALCDAGRSDDARAAAAKFRRAHPGSPLTAHLSGCTNESP